MTERFTRQGCKVTTTFTPQPNGSYTEHVTLECVEPLSLETVEPAGLSLPQRGRVRATKFGFELVEDKR
jgi:hypothetical protein